MVPEPYFLTCGDVDTLANPAIPESIINNEVESTNVMLKLRDRQPSEDRVKLGGCHE